MDDKGKEPSLRESDQNRQFEYRLINRNSIELEVTLIGGEQILPPTERQVDRRKRQIAWQHRLQIIVLWDRYRQERSRNPCRIKPWNKLSRQDLCRKGDNRIISACDWMQLEEQACQSRIVKAFKVVNYLDAQITGLILKQITTVLLFPFPTAQFTTVVMMLEYR